MGGDLKSIQKSIKQYLDGNYDKFVNIDEFIKTNMEYIVLKKRYMYIIINQNIF
jgi:hypothetical protein